MNAPDKDTMSELIKRLREYSKENQPTLFANEAFLIGMLQAVSMSLIGLTGLMSKDIPLGNIVSLFLTANVACLCVSLIFAVLSAYYKHEYKKHDLKENNRLIERLVYRQELGTEVKKQTNLNLDSMRFCFKYSAIFLIIGITLFMVASLCPLFQIISRNLIL